MCNYHKFIFILILFSGLVACSEQADTAGQNQHVWKEQTDTIDKAKAVEGIIIDSAEQTRNAIEQSE